MAWYTGKSAISVLGAGDSNILPAGGFTPSGGQVATSGLWCYISATGQVPYAEANLGWRNGVNPNGANRLAEYNDYAAGPLFNTAPFFGQILGGCGNPSMQCGAVLKNGTGIDTYVVQGARGGVNAAYFSSGFGKTSLERVIPGALASIPGSPTYFDCILISMGGNDAIQGIPEETHVTNMTTWRSNMISEGWWVPGVTQIVILDMPRSGYIWDNFSTWKGVEKVLARFNDRIGRTNSNGLELVGDNIHYFPVSCTNQGQQAGELFLAEIPWQQSTLNIGGVGLSLNGSRFRVHGN
jgi:hypothetical protein